MEAKAAAGLFTSLAPVKGEDYPAAKRWSIGDRDLITGGNAAKLFKFKILKLKKA